MSLTGMSHAEAIEKLEWHALRWKIEVFGALSGVIGRAEITDAPKPGGLGSTYGGNTLACAVALAVLDAFEQDGLPARAEQLGKKLEAGLRHLACKHAAIGDVRGLGFMQAIELVNDQSPKSWIRFALSD